MLALVSYIGPLVGPRCNSSPKRLQLHRATNPSKNGPRAFSHSRQSLGGLRSSSVLVFSDFVCTRFAGCMSKALKFSDLKEEKKRSIIWRCASVKSESPRWRWFSQLSASFLFGAGLLSTLQRYVA